MGACSFFTTAIGKTPQDAFRRAREQAEWEHGHGGYTGTVAEKHDFFVIPLPKRKKAYDYAVSILNKENSPVDDKWGPAGCIEIPRRQYNAEKGWGHEPLKRGEKVFLFFGMASS